MSTHTWFLLPGGIYIVECISLVRQSLLFFQFFWFSDSLAWVVIGDVVTAIACDSYYIQTVDMCNELQACI